MFDSYDEAIEFFNDHPHELANAWHRPSDHPYGYLFSYLTPNRNPGKRPDGTECGCPTLIKLGGDWNWPAPLVAWTDELTLAIKCNEYIPRYFSSMLDHARLEALPVLADAQRLADKMLGRPEPNGALLNLGSGI